MNYLVIVGLGALMYFMMRKGGGCCGGHSHNTHENHDKNSSHNKDNYSLVDSEDSEIIIEYDTVIDPICGMKISRNNSISMTLNGETYYFCGKRCKDEFCEQHRV